MGSRDPMDPRDTAEGNGEALLVTADGLPSTLNKVHGPMVPQGVHFSGATPGRARFLFWPPSRAEFSIKWAIK